MYKNGHIYHQMFKNPDWNGGITMDYYHEQGGLNALYTLNFCKINDFNYYGKWTKEYCW